MSLGSKYRKGAETRVKQPFESSATVLIDMKEGLHDRGQTPASTQVQAHRDGVKALLLLGCIALLGEVTLQGCLPRVRLSYGGTTTEGLLFLSCT